MTIRTKSTIAILFLAIMLLSACATMPENVHRPESNAFNDTENTTLSRIRAQERAAHESLSGFHLLGNGLDAFVARAVLCHDAERSIDAQYYLFHNDLTGWLFLDHLLKAADRGVRVRLLVDDMDLADPDIAFSDLDVICIGPVVNKVSTSFDLY